MIVNRFVALFVCVLFAVTAGCNGPATTMDLLGGGWSVRMEFLPVSIGTAPLDPPPDPLAYVTTLFVDAEQTRALVFGLCPMQPRAIELGESTEAPAWRGPAECIQGILPGYPGSYSECAETIASVDVLTLRLVEGAMMGGGGGMLRGCGASRPALVSIAGARLGHPDY